MSSRSTGSQELSHEQWVMGLPFWQRVGYRSKRVEWVLLFLLASGLMLWERLGIAWPVFRGALFVHLAASLILFPLVVMPFWLSHRQSLQTSGKRFLRLTGRFLEILLFISLASGLWLTMMGNRGGLVGLGAHWLHFLSAFPLGILLLAHAWRYSMVKRVGWLALLLVSLGLMSTPALAAVSSGSLVLGKDGKVLFSANLDAGSVSRIDRNSGERLTERSLGGDLRRLALADSDRLLAVSDYTQGKLHILNGTTLEVEESISIPGRPFGVVYDQENQLFWVALFEKHQLVGIDAKGEERVRLDTEETPRGLALLSDGRLLVSHAMVGKVSIYDTKVLPPKLTKVIALHETQNPDEFVSQGVPRLLDDIAVSPDEREAWLPHLLWNFDHPFQFQSTIFPSVSLLWLKTGEEEELPKRRKHLFKQINIIEEGSRTRIVSNPHDAAFSEDGKKVYITLAGSEDLMVFDLTRRTAIGKKKKRRARRRGKLDQGGAKVTQIFRHLPGDNPRGIVVTGEEIFVQNAMSLDMSRLRRGGSGPFAKVSMDEEKFAKQVLKDPLGNALRLGTRLFNSGNTDDFPDAPMTGDFWMSCQSCHVDGFNFTNSYLFRDTPIDKYRNVVTGHVKLGKMVAGNFVGDYIRMVRDTQGGMGFDDRFETPPTDPDKPTANVQKMMVDLHTYVRAPGNLPRLSTWLRLDGEGRTVHQKEWTNSAVCADCHQEMYDQWADSLHRLMGDSNPYYRVAEDIAAQQEGEEFRAWCMGCHHPQGLLSGQKKTVGHSHMMEQGGASLLEARESNQPDVDEGTGCLFCHRITKLEEATLAGGANASFTVNLDDREAYIFEDNSNPVLNWFGDQQINAKPEVHAASYSQPFYKDPKLCATCHNEFAPGSGALIVDTYGEWLASPFNKPEDPSKHRTCIDCHMHGDIQRIGKPVPGFSTDGGKRKENVVTHQFTGANHHLVGLRNKKLERMSIELLQSAVDLENFIDDRGRLVVRVNNVGAGHAIPTGVADLRQMWLEMTVIDASGREVLRHGHVSEDGTVPENARFFRKVFGDENGKPVGLVFWRFAKILEDTRIPPDGYRDEVYELPSGTRLPVKVKARLLFRIYPKAITDVVRQRFPELPQPDIIEMKHLVNTVG